MNKYTLRVRHLLLTLFCSMLVCLQAQAQMKIGNHPTQIHKASILELESPNQALRITQGDTTAVNTSIDATNAHDLTNANVKAAEGMIMYNVADSAVYIRTHGYWHKLIDSTVTSTGTSGEFWNLTGNTGTDSSTNLIGTTDAQGLRIGTNNQPAIIIDRAGNVQIVDSLNMTGNAGFGKSVTITDSLLVGSALHVVDSVTLETVREALPTDNEVLVISPEGVIRKRSLDALGLSSINNVSGADLHLRFDTVALSVGQHGPWIDSISGKANERILLNLPDAGTAVRGLINDSAQAFSGSKSFRDSVAVGNINKANSTLQVSGSVAMAIKKITSDYDLNTAGNARVRTILADVSGVTGNAASPTITVTLPTPVAGRIYTIKKTGDVDVNQINAYVEIVPSSGTFEDGGAQYDLYNNWTSVTLQAQNNEWYIVR